MRRRITTPARMALALVALILSAPLAHAEPLGLDDCLHMAIKGNSRMRLERQSIEIKESERDSVRGRFLPSVRAEANVLGWDSAQSFSIQMPAIPGVPTGSANSVLIHEQLTYGASVTVAQPLMQLYKIYAAYEAADAAAKAADMGALAARRKLELDVVGVYLGLLSARRMSETAQAALAQIDAYEKQVRVFLENGVVERNALLKVQVHRAEIEKGLLDAEQMAALMQARLNLLIGRPIDAPVELDEQSFALDTNMAQLLGAEKTRMRREALGARPEIEQIEHQQRAAEMARHAAIGAMLPEINAVFKYDHVGGFGAMQAENALYGGLVLSWTVWEWGASWYQLKAAEQREQHADTLRDSAEEGILLDLEAKHLNLLKAQSALRLSEAELAHAEENLRVEQNRYEANATTTTDLLDAQTMLLKARNQEILDRMSLSAAAYTLQVTLGRDLLASTQNDGENGP